MKKLLYGLLIVSAMQNVSLHGADLTSDEVLENLEPDKILEILEDLLYENRLHEIKNLYPLINNLPEDQRGSFCSTALNHYFDTHRLDELKDLYPLINNLPEDQRGSFCSTALNHYFDTHRLHELKNLYPLFDNLPKNQRGSFCSKALKHYFDTQRLHELNDLSLLINNLPENQRSSFCSTALKHYTNTSTLFKHDTIMQYCTTIPERTFLVRHEQFIQTISSLNVDEKYQKQLHMYFIRQKIEFNYLPTIHLNLSSEILKPLSCNDVVAIIEHIHESTDICGESMEKIRPLCQAYLMHCEDLPNSMPIKHFTDLFEPFRTRTPLLAKITDSVVTFKSIVPQSLMKISKFKGDPLTFKPDTPEKIQELYRQYKHTGIVGDTLVISRDEELSVE